MFTNPEIFFNTTLVNETAATIINGTMSSGSFQVIAEVYGMDLLVSLAIIQTFFIIMMFCYMVFGRNLRRMKK
jgi:hypothetical protein